MNCMFTMQKEYIDLIFNGKKPFDFKNVSPKFKEDDKVYLFDSSEKKVRGYYTVKDISEIDHKKLKIGTYLFIDTFSKMFCDKKIQESVNKAKQVKLENYYNSYVLEFLFMDDLIEEMINTHKPPVQDFLRMNKEEMKEYNLIRQKQTDFLSYCDNWLTQIGFYNYLGNESTWKYKIDIKKVVKFEQPLDINKFQKINGTYLKTAPKNFCYIKENDF